MTARAAHPRGNALVLAATASVFALMAIVGALPLSARKPLLTEGGPVETLSAIGYIVCIGLIVALWPRAETRARWYFPVVLALFAGRELDLDKRPFTEGLLKARQYTGDTVPTGELIWSSALLLAILATLAILLWHETKPFLRGLARRSPVALAVLVGVVFIGFYKAIDGLGRKLAPFGITISEDLNNSIAVVEEIGELGIPLMLGIAIVLAARPLRAAR